MKYLDRVMAGGDVLYVCHEDQWVKWTIDSWTNNPPVIYSCREGEKLEAMPAGVCFNIPVLRDGSVLPVLAGQTPVRGNQISSRDRCAVHLSTLTEDGCRDCNRIDGRRGNAPGTYNNRRGMESGIITHSHIARTEAALAIADIGVTLHQSTPWCAAHGFIQSECHACKENERTAKVITKEAARIEAAKLAPIGKGPTSYEPRRRLNMATITEQVRPVAQTSSKLFALRNDDGVEHREQVAYVDGYGFAERQLEGVRFRVRRFLDGGGYQLHCSSVHPGDEALVAKFNYAQRSAWYLAAIRCLTHNDMDATAEDGTNVHWGVD